MSKTIEEQALAFHADNPQVFSLFEMLAFRAVRAGRKTLSVAQIWEVMRWEYALRSPQEDTNPWCPDQLKLNNNYRAYYARWFMEKWPDAPVTFRTRVVKSRAPGKVAVTTAEAHGLAA